MIRLIEEFRFGVVTRVYLLTILLFIRIELGCIGFIPPVPEAPAEMLFLPTLDAESVSTPGDTAPLSELVRRAAIERADNLDGVGPWIRTERKRSHPRFT